MWQEILEHIFIAYKFSRDVHKSEMLCYIGGCSSPSPRTSLPIQDTRKALTAVSSNPSLFSRAFTVVPLTLNTASGKVSTAAQGEGQQISLLLQATGLSPALSSLQILREVRHDTDMDSDLPLSGMRCPL